MNRESMSAFDLSNVTIKQEKSVHIDQEQSVCAESRASRDSFDNKSMWSASTISFDNGLHNADQDLTNLGFAIENQLNVDDKVQQKEEKPVVHRNTGKISVENIRRRHRRMNYFPQNSNHRPYSDHRSTPISGMPQQTTASLTIEPVLASTSNIILVSTQTSPETEEVFELSDEEEEVTTTQTHQLVPPQQTPQQMQPAIPIGSTLGSIFDATIAAFQQRQQTVQKKKNTTRVHCDACNRDYAHYTFRKHEKTMKHQVNLRAAQQQNLNTNGTGDQ